MCDLIPTESNLTQPPPLPVAASVEDLLLKAVEAGASVETLERLMALREKMHAELAKREFDAAMAKFQAACPTINKSKSVMDKYGKLRYHYAPLEHIVAQTKDLMGECGLSYSIDIDIKPGTPSWVMAVCTAKHLAGHAQFSKFEVPVDPDAYMSDPQKFASAQTFARRYAFCNAFGIMTGDEDTDNAEHRREDVRVESRQVSDTRRDQNRAAQVDDDFSAPDGFTEFEVVEFYPKQSSNGKDYYSYKLRCVESGKVGWVSCWDGNVARAAEVHDIPPQPGTKFRAWIRQGKSGYWAIDQFGQPEGLDSFDADDIDLGPPLDFDSFPLGTPGD